MSERRQLSLNFFIYPDGHHEAAWRHRRSAADRILDITYYQELAQHAEAHKFDAVFFADGPALADNVRYAQRFRLEPITLLTAIASATQRIGATSSTTYTEPYNLARLFASLDHISSGRAGWNIVTTSTPQAAQNFGLPEHPPHHERYERARSRGFGTAGKTTRSSTTRSPGFSPTPARSTRLITSESISACVGRSTSQGRRGDDRSMSRPALPTTDVPLRRVLPRRSSPRVRHWRAPRNSTPTSSIRRAFDRSPDQIKILSGISPFIASTQIEADRLQDEFNELIQPEYSLPPDDRSRPLRV